MLQVDMAKAQEVFKYPNSSITAYMNKGSFLLDTVNESLKKHASIIELLGDNPISLMENNHLNHYKFMLNIIEYKQLDLLISTLPWVYHTYAKKGVSYDYFIIELNTWIEAITKHINQEDQAHLIKVYELMISWHDSIIEASKENDTLDHFSHFNWGDMHEKIYYYLIRGEYSYIIQKCKKILSQNNNVTDLYQLYLQPVMYKVGKDWQEGNITVAHEHLATSTIARVMSSIYPDFILSDTTKGKAIISASTNEHHEIGARMIADALEYDGWDIQFVGSDVPLDALITYINEINPMFVGLSLTMSFNTEQLVNTIKTIRKECRNKKLKIMAGGLAINETESLIPLLKADAYPKNVKEAMEVAKLWWLEDH